MVARGFASREEGKTGTYSIINHGESFKVKGGSDVLH